MYKSIARVDLTMTCKVEESYCMKDKRDYYVAVDFDGTLFEHKYPAMGKPIPKAFYWGRRFQELGAKLILLTMRSDQYLADAVKACADHGLEFTFINDNPTQLSWTQSRKVYANKYIDDNAAGTPLIYPAEGRPYVDWNVVGPIVVEEIISWRGNY